MDPTRTGPGRKGSIMQSDLPARPDLPFRPEFAAPRKHRGWAIAGSVLGGLIVLGAIGSVIDSGEPGTRVASPDPITVTEPVSYEGLNVEETVDLFVAGGLLPDFCSLIDAGMTESQFTSTEPHLGPYAFEVALYDDMVGRC
jgi:hypothetical protein